MALCLNCTTIIGGCLRVVIKYGARCITLIVMPLMGARQRRGFSGMDFQTCLRPYCHRLRSYLVLVSGDRPK